MFRAGGGPGGGFVSTAPSDGQAHLAHKPGEVLVYIGSEDSEASSRQVEAHGGAVILAKTEIPKPDRFAVFTDLSGNRVGLYTPMHPQPQRYAPDAPSGPAPGAAAIAHTGLMCHSSMP